MANGKGKRKPLERHFFLCLTCKMGSHEHCFRRRRERVNGQLVVSICTCQDQVHTAD